MHDSLLFLMKLIGVGVLGLLIYVSARFLVFLFRLRPRRPKEPGFEYVYIDNDGNARELEADEQEYLQRDFEFGDGGRPYIKGWYEELTPDFKMQGYLRRRQLPKWIKIEAIQKPIPESERI